MQQVKRPNKVVRSREDNSIVFLDIFANGGVHNKLTGYVTEPRLLGRMYIELRQDLVPTTCSNFLSLVSGARGIGTDGIHYTYKGTKVHRICQDFLFQAGDLLGLNGNCSKSVFNGGYFNDENFLLRHTGPGVLSMCNHGPNTNGSVFQITLIENQNMDDRYVVFGYLVGEESFETLQAVNACGTDYGAPKEEIIVSDCGVTFPKPMAGRTTR
mmetsp:Transcript_10031/g.10136  ORF Transcript_10031/g.10136 Transcript_10031/m.10136 type:complete len:213 (+) Transcript_10031:70-708(+)